MIDLNKNYYCIILAGGVGTRFWPVSRESRPKQFHSPSPGGKTFLRLTYERFADFFPPENIIVVSLLRYKELVKIWINSRAQFSRHLNMQTSITP